VTSVSTAVTSSTVKHIKCTCVHAYAHFNAFKNIKYAAVVVRKLVARTVAFTVVTLCAKAVANPIVKVVLSERRAGGQYKCNCD
jgi:hypothetical protein